MKNKKFAFTLSEVLITLMILGVIAMIVIPSTISKIKKHQTEVKLKKIYSTLNQMLLKGQSNNYITYTELINMGEWNAMKYFHENFAPQLNISKDCSGSNQDICGEMFKIIKKYDGIANDSYYGDWFSRNGWSHKYILSDGTFLAVWYWPAFKSFQLVLDIDGVQGPSTQGVDIFYFTIGTSGLGNIWTRCEISSSSSYNGYGCSKKIMENGWKIPETYPINF